MSITPMSPAINQQGWVQTWVTSQWKNRPIPGQFSAEINSIDFALLVDGLEIEREQHITIDVAYRFFSTMKRSFIVADTPGHEQYTRNMISGASTADLAILLADARKGLLLQSRRHAILASLLGIKHVVLAVNKMDTVDYSEHAFRRIDADFRAFARPLAFDTVASIPISALRGDNIATHNDAMPWYRDKTLLETLETLEIDDNTASELRFPVQWVNRPSPDFRGFAGTIASGEIKVGDELTVPTARQSSRVKHIYLAANESQTARAGDAVTLTFTDEIDVARGDVLCRTFAKPQIGDQFSANVVWMSEEPMQIGRSYLMKIGSTLVPVVVGELYHRLDVTTLDTMPASTLAMNDIGACKLVTSRKIAFDPYKTNHLTGAFILIDRSSNATVGAGMIDRNLTGPENVFYQHLMVSKAQRAAQKFQTPKVIWFTGISGAGKTTIANLVEASLHVRGAHTMLLDGDNVRHGLNRDLGFSEDARLENIRRVGEMSKLMTEAGLIVLCCFISPFLADRQMVRDLMLPGEFIEVFVSVPIEIAIQRDPKGLYKRALAGEIKNFTGIDQRYESSDAPDLILDTAVEPAQALAGRVIKFLESIDAISKI